MSRRTDTERGARLAFDAAVDQLHPDLFGLGDEEMNALWSSIFDAAAQQLQESKWARSVTARA